MRVPDIDIPDEFFQHVAERAELEWLGEKSGWFATVPGYKGAWANGPTQEAARDELATVLRDWVAVGVHFGDPLPAEVQAVLTRA